ncbi:MAG: T9SS type A sorting domain-containing protein [Ignavibacteriales bacterium]|nr:MAG: T9SS type A sorting domain-containing protein [Ignavibacteriales bacterium]
MKTIFTFLFAFLFLQSAYSQWQMMNSPLATPDIQKVAYHPNGYVLAITNENEVFRSDIAQSNWSKVATLNNVVQCIDISPAGTIYAGIIGGYLYSTDIGLTWNEKQLFQHSVYFITDLEFDANGNLFMVSSGHTSILPCIYISNDGGNTWTSPMAGLPTDGYSVVGIEKDSVENIYILLHSYPNSKLYKSTDDGNSWQLVSIMEVSFSNDFKIDRLGNFYTFKYHGASGLIYKSTDGINWNEIYSGIIQKLFIDTENNIYAALEYKGYTGWVDSGYTYYNMILSSDGGSNWQLMGLAGLKAHDFIRVENKFFIATSNGLRTSIISSNQWSLCFEYHDRNAIVSDILNLSAEGRKLIGTARGLMHSEEVGESWVETSVHPSIKFIKNDNFGNIYATSKYLYRSTDFGLTWEIPHDMESDNPREIKNIFINDSGYIFTIQNLVVQGFYIIGLKSTDFGSSWITQFSQTCACNASTDAHSIIENLSGALFLSFNLILYPTPPPSIEYRRWVVKKEPGFNEQVLFENQIANNMYLFNSELYMAMSSYSSSSLGVLKTSDNGSTFVQLNNGLSSLKVTQLILKPEVFLALTGDGIYRSLDQGNYWMRLDHTGLTGTINRIYLDDNQTLYACTSNGIYVFTGELPVELLTFTTSIETGRVTLNWSTASELNNRGFEIQRKSKNAEWMTIGFKEGKGTTTEKNEYTYTDDVAGINSSEVYYRLKQIDYDGTYTYSEEVKVSLIPFKYELYQNYPNPFNPSTKISWQSPVGSHQTIKVYDVLGNEVATLVNEYKEAGSYEVEFDGSSLASGMYIYKLSSGGFTSSKKMMVIK